MEKMVWAESFVLDLSSLEKYWLDEDLAAAMAY
jgi:hypothetical protein